MWDLCACLIIQESTAETRKLCSRKLYSTRENAMLLVCDIAKGQDETI